MPKFFLIVIFIIFLIGCKTPDYFNQKAPKSKPIIFAPNVISVVGRFEHGISFSPDNQEVVFGILSNNDLSGQIYHLEKIKNKWSEPIPFEPLKNQSVYLPYFTPDGRSLLYAYTENKEDNASTNIGILIKANAYWEKSKPLLEQINSRFREGNASMTLDRTIYFSSNRGCERKENCHQADLYISKKSEDGYQEVQPIIELNSGNDEESVFVSPNEDYIIFCNYTGDETGADLYISYKTFSNNWTQPLLIDSTINSKDWDRRPYVTFDKRFLFFTRLKIDQDGLKESDIYWVNTSKLFKPFEYKPVKPILARKDLKFEIDFPKEFFKDIDSDKLKYEIIDNQYDWLKFDPNKLKISGTPIKVGTFEVTISAKDKHGNRSNGTITFTVVD